MDKPETKSKIAATTKMAMKDTEQHITIKGHGGKEN
jgi:hypothetical protein